MKLPTQALFLVAATASAQMSMPRVDTRPAYKSTLEAGYASVSSDTGDSDGTVLAARLYFYGNNFVSVSRNDASFANSSIQAHQFTYGIGATEAWGQGTVTAAYAHGELAGDLPSLGQDIFSLGYELGVAPGLTAGLTIAHTLNAGDIEDSTATVLGLRYELTGGLSLTASFASEDTLLGRAGASRTWKIGARYGF